MSPAVRRCTSCGGPVDEGSMQGGGVVRPHSASSIRSGHKNPARSSPARSQQGKSLLDVPLSLASTAASSGCQAAAAPSHVKAAKLEAENAKLKQLLADANRRAAQAAVAAATGARPTFDQVTFDQAKTASMSEGATNDTTLILAEWAGTTKPLEGLPAVLSSKRRPVSATGRLERQPVSATDRFSDSRYPPGTRFPAGALGLVERSLRAEDLEKERRPAHTRLRRPMSREDLVRLRALGRGTRGPRRATSRAELMSADAEMYPHTLGPDTYIVPTFRAAYMRPVSRPHRNDPWVQALAQSVLDDAGGLG